jgi:hypothetical protein
MKFRRKGTLRSSTFDTHVPSKFDAHIKKIVYKNLNLQVTRTNHFVCIYLDDVQEESPMLPESYLILHIFVCGHYACYALR